MCEWLRANGHGDLLDDTDGGGHGGKSQKELWALVEPRIPPKEYAIYAIAKKYGHKVRRFHYRSIIWSSRKT